MGVIVEFHEADDECVPFPHRVLTIPTHIAMRHREEMIIREQKFVICALCDHWIRSRVTRCPCKQRCHDLGQLLAELGDSV